MGFLSDECTKLLRQCIVDLVPEPACADFLNKNKTVIKYERIILLITISILFWIPDLKLISSQRV